MGFPNNEIWVGSSARIGSNRFRKIDSKCNNLDVLIICPRRDLIGWATAVCTAMVVLSKGVK